MSKCGSKNKETDPEWHFHIFSSPDLHLVIVCTNVFKVFLWDWEETSSKSRRPGSLTGRYKSFRHLKWLGVFQVKPTWSFLLYRVSFILAQPLGIIWDSLPAESQAPVKVPSVGSPVAGHRPLEIEVVEVNGGDLGTHHSSGLFNNTGQQGLEPSRPTLTYTREGGEISLCISFLTSAIWNTFTANNQSPSISVGNQYWQQWGQSYRICQVDRILELDQYSRPF